MQCSFCFSAACATLQNAKLIAKHEQNAELATHLRANGTHLLVNERAMELLKSKKTKYRLLLATVKEKWKKNRADTLGDTPESSHTNLVEYELVRLSRTAAWPRGLHTPSLRQPDGFTTVFAAPHILQGNKFGAARDTSQ